LIDTLARIVGSANVLADAEARSLAGADLFTPVDRVVPDLVVRPADTAEVAELVRALASANRAIVPRGAGLSYTGGVVPHSPAVVLDLTRLNRMRILPDDMVAVVGAGCTWERLAQALQPYGLCVAQSSPISGSYSTIGGAASQNVPGTMDGFLGLCVVLADGTITHTGSWAVTNSVPFYRNVGPDLTGLFLGDCGAFGVKTEIALRLVTEPAYAFASFTFERSEELCAVMLTLQRAGLVTRCFAMDQAKAAAASQVDANEALRTAAAVAARAGSVRAMISDVAGLRRARADITEAAWSLHLTVEARTEQGAIAQMQAAREICCRQAKEIPAAVPKALHARPYSVRGFVGPAGERWVPVHGLCPLSRAGAALTEMQAAVRAHADELAAAEIKVNWLISSQCAYILFEPMFYWPDQLDPIHMQYLSARNRARFASFPHNAAARALVAAMRDALRDIMDRHGAVHMQVGRYYHLADAVDSGSRALLQRIKRAVDPDGRMNSGALEL
jgi:D-lactate dehydrogenase (cytochrome)